MAPFSWARTSRAREDCPKKKLLRCAPVLSVQGVVEVVGALGEADVGDDGVAARRLELKLRSERYLQ